MLFYYLKQSSQKINPHPIHFFDNKLILIES